MRSRAEKPFQRVIAQLEAFYGPPAPPAITDPLQMILYENVAYLVKEAQHQTAFAALGRIVGLRPTDILSAPAEKLLQVAKLGGMLPEGRVRKLQSIAQIALQDFAGDLGAILHEPLPKAKRLLKKFPGIGDPGAEKILLFSRTFRVLALDSNALRVLTRLGFGAEHKSYAAMYRSAQDAVEGQLKEDFSWLIAAHQLLQRHGRELCRRSAPMCASCPLAAGCRGRPPR